MTIKENAVYLFPILLSGLAAFYKSPAFAYASCLALGLILIDTRVRSYYETKIVKVDDHLKHKVEQMEAAISAMVSREKARGF